MPLLSVIIILTIALVALFIDWSELRARVVELLARATDRPARQPREPKQPKPAKAAKRSKHDLFSEDDQFSVIPQERQQVASAYQDPLGADAAQGPKLPQRLQEFMDTADAHFRKGEYKAAEDFYVKVAAEDAKCSKAYARLGLIYLELGEDFADAEEAFRQALKTDSGNGNLLNNLGLVLYHQDKYAEAVRTFEQAVRLDEANASRHANLGMAYLAMRQYAKAESSFKKALKLAPNEIEYKDLLAEAVEKKLAHRTMVRK